MFTGIIEEIATVESFIDGRLVLKTDHYFDDVPIGGSIAVNGCCLTLVRKETGKGHFDLVQETISRTTFGSLKRGDRLNLERPLHFGGRLDGHFVQGHVDGLGKVEETGTSMKISVPQELCPFIMEKGSIAIDGISLTVGKVIGNCFYIHLIPHTLEKTTIGSKRPDEWVNIETDIIAKYTKNACKYN